MDARVNDFLNEINEITPLGDNKEESVWEKCLDDNSSYYYYWNTKTNEVTWDMPLDYKPKSKGRKQPVSLYIPPRTNHLIASTSSLLPPVSDAIKIYKIGECADSNNPKVQWNKHSVDSKSNCDDKKHKEKITKPPRRRNSSEDEKIVLISSYGGDSESEDEKRQISTQSSKVNGVSKPSSAQNSDNEEDTDILSKIHEKAKELRELDDHLPPSTRNSLVGVSKPKISPKSTGFSLVAGYSDSEEEPEEVIETNKLQIIAPPPPQDFNKVSHSTLFPVHKPIDLKDFESEINTNEICVSSVPTTDFDAKVFSRKKRIGVSLVNTGKRPKSDDDKMNEGEVRTGLGFSNSGSSSPTPTSSSSYQGFKSGGVMFVKTNNHDREAIEENNSKNSELDNKGIEDSYTTLKEKLGFLSEGRDPVFPVQAMLIQVETLHSALKAGDLKPSYLWKWLDDTSSDLIKLERETTPEGWLLQWDRSHKRYFYQNEATGESQWEYPEADVTRCDDAMDICTTPPPCGAEQNIHMSPPLPPMIKSPSPPPPPTISECMTSIKNKNKKPDIPLPPEPNPPLKKKPKTDGNDEPLPPGVDLPEASTSNQDSKSKDGPDLSDALSSFYSDIAAIETNSPKAVTQASEDPKSESEVAGTEIAKKKKKNKVKLTQGIAMKKKGVSKLVEKWKNVQMSYNE